MGSRARSNPPIDFAELVLDFGGWLMGCRGGGSQRRPTTAENKHKRLISAVVGRMIAVGDGT